MRQSILIATLLTTFLATTSCEKSNIDEEIIELDINEVFSTDPGETLEPGGSGGGDNSEREDI